MLIKSKLFCVLLGASLAPAAARAADARKLFIQPQSIVERAGSLDLQQVAVRASAAVPANAFGELVRGLRSRGIAAGSAYTIHLLNLAHAGDRALLPKLTSQPYRRDASGQGYLIDLAGSPGHAVIAGDGDRGVWYAVQTFLDLLGLDPHRLPRAVIRDRPDIAFRMAHQQGIDKGYGAGDRWTVTDFERHLPLMFDCASRSRLTDIVLNMEAGWINGADRELSIDLDALMKRLVARGRQGMVGLVISVEYAKLLDCGVAEAAFRKIRSFQVSGAESSRLAQQIRRPLCPVTEKDEYLKAVRRAFSWGVDGVLISFDDFSETNCEACRRAYGTADIRLNGKAMARIAQDVDRVRREVAPAARLYFLPAFYGTGSLKRHPDAFPDLVSGGPRSMRTVMTLDLDLPVPASLHKRYGVDYSLWINLTSNSGKDKKTWFPVAEIDEPGNERKLRGRPGSDILLNLGAVPGPQLLTLLASGAWLWNDKGMRGEEILEKSAAIRFGPEAAPLVREYAGLIAWPVVAESIGRTIRDRLLDRAALPQTLALWRDNEKRAARARDLARRIAAATTAVDPRFGPELEWNAERIRREYEIALLFGAMAASGGRAELPLLERRMREFKEFILAGYVIPNDAKDAEVVSRGYQALEAILNDLDGFLRRPSKPVPRGSSKPEV